jgi:hypothetical protein
MTAMLHIYLKSPTEDYRSGYRDPKKNCPAVPGTGIIKDVIFWLDLLEVSLFQFGR